jgi:AraC-like DNA-binding protein
MRNAFAASVAGPLAADLRSTHACRTAASFKQDAVVTEEEWMSCVLDYIDVHLGECELDERMIRERFNLSRATLYRRFQLLGGVSNYIRERRLQLAYRHLQRDPTCSLTWLLYEVGFASERQFQRSFQARFGMSPAHWRRSCRS